MKELADLKRILPKGSKRDIDTKQRTAVIIAPPGKVWAHNNMKKLHYFQPTTTRNEFFSDICFDVSRGTLPQKRKRAGSC